MKRKMYNYVFSIWDLFWIKLDFFCSTLRSRISLGFQGCLPGKGFQTSGHCYFKARRSGSIRIGSNVSLLAGQRTNRVGMTGPVVLETLGDGEVEIGDDSGGSAVVISARAKISVGQRVKLGGNVRIFDHDFHSLEADVRKTSNDRKNVNSRPVRIGDDVFVGTNALILKGVSVGDRAIIAAGSVVTKDIPSDEIWGGNPAVRIRGKKTDGGGQKSERSKS